MILGSRISTGQRSNYKNNHENTVATLIATSSAGLNTAFGLSLADLINFMKNWLLYIIGAGFGVLDSLMPYIVGLVVISAIVYFLFRAFRFFRH